MEGRGRTSRSEAAAEAQRRRWPSGARFREAGKRSSLILSLRSPPRRVPMGVGDRRQAHRCAGGGVGTRIRGIELAARNRSARFPAPPSRASSKDGSAVRRLAPRAPAVQHRRCARGGGERSRTDTPASGPVTASTRRHAKGGGGFGRRTPLEHAAAVRSRNARAAIHRVDFRPCDPRKSSDHRRIRAPGGCRPGSPIVDAPAEGYERRARSRRAEVGGPPAEGGADHHGQVDGTCRSRRRRSGRPSRSRICGRWPG